MKNNDKFEQMKRAHELKYPLACQKLTALARKTRCTKMLNEVLTVDNFLARLSQRYFYRILY